MRNKTFGLGVLELIKSRFGALVREVVLLPERELKRGLRVLEAP